MHYSDIVCKSCKGSKVLLVDGLKLTLVPMVYILKNQDVFSVQDFRVSQKGISTSLQFKNGLLQYSSSALCYRANLFMHEMIQMLPADEEEVRHGMSPLRE